MHVEQEPSEDILSASEFRYRRVLTWASIVTFVCILSAFLLWIPSWKGINRWLGLLFLLPFLLPYGFIPLRLHSRRFRNGLTLAIAMSCAMFVPGIYLIRFVSTWDKRWWILGNLSLALLMQSVLIVIAAKTFISMPRVPHGRVRLLGSLSYGILLFGLFWSFYSPVPRYITANENSARGYLFSCALHAFLDAFRHGGSYPPDFASLASSSEPKCMTTGPWVINPSNPRDGYFFEYAGSPPWSTVEDCTRFKSFTMTARPVIFGRTGIRSFFVDKNMDVHATSENRPANAGDPIEWTLNDEARAHNP